MSTPRATTSSPQSGWQTVVALVLAAVLSAGCGSGGVRQAETSPGMGQASGRPTIVLIPGISREVSRVLRGSIPLFSALALKTDGEAVARLGDPRFAAGDAAPLDLPGRLDRALRGVPVRGLQPLIDRLIQQEGYVRRNPGNPADRDYPENRPGEEPAPASPSLFVLYYDFRRDIPETACLLADTIGRIQAAAGTPRVRLLGHSLGGTLARYIVRYGHWDAAAGQPCPLAGQPAPAAAPVVERAAFLGAPLGGTPVAFQALIQDVSVFGLGLGLRDSAFTMPVAWQLLPPVGPDGFVPILGEDAGEDRVALYDLRTWRQRGWLDDILLAGERLRFAEAMLARSAALHRAMQGSQPEEERIPRLAVASTCRPTPGRLADMPGLHLSFRSPDPRISLPGDGVVTAESATAVPAAPGLTVATTCTRHNGYLDAPEILEQVTRFLLD
jgi:hypothetical protein